MLNNILLRLLGISNTVIDGPTIQCEVSEHVYVIYYNKYRIFIVTFLYSELQRYTLINVQNTRSNIELNTVPPMPARKCPLGKFRSSILHDAYQMHRFRGHTT